ncbi:hypothetical protein FIU97_03150 [Roseivivax sp. THAF40]|uniref:hypothetical protein n=1 Tax=unclassified Roseivivax TaxID=2639302 RepID=UPI001268ACF2|nr:MULTISPECIES: hypothetical protein [unclassified Roseivivax]QFS81764.1 hypothetical protein FIV09_02890 [Roseivivax sp. THAF197b]QFT45564.1 hypothetical protein FIU97_03150 [Roseivivax sp. THAF40]
MSRAGRSILAICLALAALFTLLTTNPAATGAERATTRAALTAGAVYVSLRAINATLSVAQEIELGGALGVSANAQPLKVLEPVDDTVERVAASVFAVSVAAATLSATFGPLSVLGAGLLLAALLPWLLCPDRLGGTRRVLDRAVIAGAALAFVLPLLFWSGSTLAERLTATRMAAAEAELTEIADRARGISEARGEALAPDADRSFFSSATEGFGEMVETMTFYRENVTYFLERADDLFRASLTVIGLLLLETLILPIVIVALTLWILRRSMP